MIDARIVRDIDNISVSEKLNDLSVSVKKFGAKGNNTDDTTAIKNAFKAAYDNGNIKLYFPEGTYNISDYIQVYKNTTVIFHPNAIVKRIGTINKMFANGTMNNANYVANSGYTGDGNIHFYGGTFDLNCQVGSLYPLAKTQTVSFFDLGHAENISFHSITVKNGQIGHCFQLSSVKNVKIKDSWFGDFRYSPDLPTDGSNPNYNYELIQIEVATPLSFPSFGSYDLSPSKDIFIENCTFENVIRAIGTHSMVATQTTTGSMTNFSNGLVVADVSKFAIGEAILVEGANENGGNLSTTITSISGSTLTLATAASTSVTNARVSNKTDMNIPAVFCENINIINNTFKGSIDNILNLQAFRYSSVKNNTVMNAGGYGISLSQVEDSEIIGNTIVNSTKAGVNTKYAHRNKFSNIIKDPCLSTLNSYSANRLDNSNNNTFDNDTVYSLNPNFTYAWYTTSGTGNKILSHNYTKGKTNTFGGDNFSLAANRSWCSVGDSITRGNNSGNGYFQDHALPLMPKITTSYIRGYGGYTAAISSTSAYSSINSIMTDVEVADVYTVFLGTNDFSRNVPIGSSADAVGKTDSFWGGLKQIYASLISKNINAVIIFITPMKRNDYLPWDTANTAGLKLNDYAQAVKDFASMNGCPVLDLFNESGISTTTAATFTYDGLHPVLETNKRIGRMIGNKINQYI